MAIWSKLYALLGFLPDVQHADQMISHRQKVVYTTVSLFIFLAASQLPLYGIQLHPGTRPDRLYWGRPHFASNSNTPFMYGVGPIVLSEILMQTLVALKRINVDSNAPEGLTLLNRVQKLMGILLTISGSIMYVLHTGAVGKFGTLNAVLILLQILFSGIIVIYLDDVLKKGYGLLSSVSLFTATSICGNVLWKAFSPMVFIYHEQGAQFEGAVPAWVHLLMTRTDKLSAMREAFYRQNLPNVSNLLATCLFILIVIFFQGLSIALPVRTHDIPWLQVNCLIRISKIFYGLIILHCLMVQILFVTSKLLYMKYGGNKLVGWIVYYLTAPPSLADLHRNPLYVFIYIVFLLGAYVLLSAFWLRVSASSKRFRDGLIVSDEEQRVMLAEPDSIPRNEFTSHVVKAAYFGGFCVGALIISGDLIGVFGSGSEIILAVTALYPYFHGRADEVSAFGF